MVTICKLVLWFLTFAAAYFIQSTELISLATAFFALHAAIIGILLVSLLLICAFGKEAALKTYGSFLIRILRFTVAILITSIFSFLATLLLTVDFCTAYMLISLGQCMYNIDVVDENDFTLLKAKLKSKKVKLNKPTMPGKKKAIAQTITDKKAQQPVNEVTPAVENTSHEEKQVIPEFEDYEEFLEDADIELPNDVIVEPAELIQQVPHEPKFNPDIPLD